MCASIMISTAMPRSQSRYGRRSHGTMVCAVSSVMSSRRECQTEQYLSRDKRDGPLDDGVGHLTVNVKVERRLRDAMRNLGLPLRDDRRAKRGQRVTSLPDDVEDVHAHAGGQPDHQHLHGRRAGGAVTVDDGRDLPAGHAEPKVVLPHELGGDRRLPFDSTYGLAQGRPATDQ